VVLVNLDPAVGTEARKTRPALVVSNDRAVATAMRLRRGVLTVLPITGNTDRIFPFQVHLDEDVASACGLDKPGKIQAEQIRSVDLRRIHAELGHLPAGVEPLVRRAMALHLALD
jgi:mRNA interferase MazF